tara:strand:- start:57928 stop:59169 length:1242 start_codon:yes stop_codon:yes gene_type:complete
MSELNFKRYTIKSIQEALLDTPVVFIMGPRQSGKTTIVRHLINDDWTYVNLDNETQLNLIKEDPIGFINNLTTRQTAIDEIQRCPELLIAIKRSVDENREAGRFLLTGSANAMLFPQVADSLAGRIEVIKLEPLSECEIHSTAPQFFDKLLNQDIASIKPNSLNQTSTIERIVTGCFPEPVRRSSEKRKQAWYKQYVNALVSKDLNDIEHIEQPDKMLDLVKLSAYYSGKLINFSEIGNKLDLSHVSVKKYLSLLEQLFLLKPLPAWHSNESKRLIKTPKLHLSDTGLNCAIRDIDANYLTQHRDEMGNLLESFVINELQKQAAWYNKSLNFYHYRDKDKVEVDCIIENARGDTYAVEVKASATLTQKDFSGLKRFKELAGDTFKTGIVIYDGEQISAFGDNLFAVPLSTLWS